MGHRYIAAFENQDEAFLHAASQLNEMALVVDYIDPYTGIDAVLKLQRQYPEKMHLDAIG